jgi:RNA polymerase sigma-70 factor (ECF subfamily)
LQNPFNECSPVSVLIGVVFTGENILREAVPATKPDFEAMVEDNRQQVVRTAYRILGNVADAQDASQEVFLRLHKNLLQIDGNVSGWLYRVTVNVCRDVLRRRKPVLELLERADPAPGPERELAMAERKRVLMEGLKTLPESQRTAVVLRDIEGLTTREVASILGVEEVTIRSQISMARVKLAKYVRRKR